MRPSLAALPALACCIAACALLGGCAQLHLFGMGAHPATRQPAVDPATAAATQLAGYLEAARQMMQAPALQQAQILADAQRQLQAAPSADHKFHYALLLAVPGQPGTDLQQARQLLREVLQAPSALPPVQQAFGALELRMVDNQLTLSADNKELQATVDQAEHDRVAGITRRLQDAQQENAHLRRELDAAHAKLDAIANIEQSINQRKPATPAPPATKGRKH